MIQFLKIILPTCLVIGLINSACGIRPEWDTANCEEKVIWQVEREGSDTYDYPLYVDKDILFSVQYDMLNREENEHTFTPVIRNPESGAKISSGAPINWSTKEFHHFFEGTFYFVASRGKETQVLDVESMTILDNLPFRMEAAVNEWAYGTDGVTDTFRIYNLHTGEVILPPLQRYYTGPIRKLGLLDGVPYYFEVMHPDSAPTLHRMRLDNQQSAYFPLTHPGQKIRVYQIMLQEDMVVVNYKPLNSSPSGEQTYHQLFALDAMSFDSLWTVSRLDLPIRNIFTSLGTGGNEDLIFIHNGGYLVALDRETGGLVWNWETIEGFPPLETHKREMIAGQHRVMMTDGEIICFHDVSNNDYFIYDPIRDALYFGGVNYRAIETE